MTKLFGFDVSTKLHKVMQYVVYHVINLACIREGSYEQNAECHKQFRELYNHKNRHIERIAPELLNS